MIRISSERYRHPSFVFTIDTMAFEFRISATKSRIASASSGHEFWFPSCKTGRNRRPEPLILLFDLIC